MKLFLLIFKLSQTDLKQVMWSSWSGLFFLRNVQNILSSILKLETWLLPGLAWACKACWLKGRMIFALKKERQDILKCSRKIRSCLPRKILNIFCSGTNSNLCSFWTKCASNSAKKLNQWPSQTQSYCSWTDWCVHAQLLWEALDMLGSNWQNR